MIKLYHSPQSRSSRFIWLLEELGEPYEIEYVTIRRGDGSGAVDPKNPNPDGKVPTLIHDGRPVMESAAICLYLSDAFPRAGLGPGPSDPRRADYLTWLFFYAGEVEPALVSKFTGVVDKDERSARLYNQVVDRFATAVERAPYIMGDAFSAADVLYGSIVHWGMGMLPSRPVFDAYGERLNARPALQRAQARDAAPDLAEPVASG
jgi:glutathione S-transferase